MYTVMFSLFKLTSFGKKLPQEVHEFGKKSPDSQLFCKLNKEKSQHWFDGPQKEPQKVFTFLPDVLLDENGMYAYRNVYIYIYAVYVMYSYGILVYLYIIHVFLVE